MASVCSPEESQVSPATSTKTATEEVSVQRLIEYALTCMTAQLVKPKQTAALGLSAKERKAKNASRQMALRATDADLTMIATKGYAIPLTMMIMMSKWESALQHSASIWMCPAQKTLAVHQDIHALIPISAPMSATLPISVAQALSAN